MKLHFTGVLLLCCLSQLACVSSNPKTTASTPVKQEKVIPAPGIKSLFSPGTVGLEFQINSAESQGPSILITARGLSVIGSGAGITQMFSPGDHISFSMAKERKIDITFHTPMKALFSLHQEMGSSKAKLQYQKSIKP